MSKLSDQQINQIDHALAERRVTNTCLSCGDKQLETAGYLHDLPIYRQAAGETTASVVRICNHCGYVQHYAVVRLGLNEAG